MEVIKMTDYSLDKKTNKLSFVIKRYTRTPKITRYIQKNYVRTPIYEGYSERIKVIKKFDKVINPIRFVNEDILKLDLEKRFILSIIEKISIIPEWRKKEIELERISNLINATKRRKRNYHNEKKGVYIIWDKTKDKHYVGQSKDMGKRLNQHFTNGEVKNIIFAKDWYAGDLFYYKFYLCQTKDELDSLQKEKIEEYNAFSKGYNSTGGNR